MKINAEIKPGKKENRVYKETKQTLFNNEEEIYIVETKEIPEKGKANKAAIETLGQFFKIPPSKIKIVHGFKSKKKTIEITE